MRDPIFYERARIKRIKQEELRQKLSTKGSYREYEKKVRELTELQPFRIMENYTNRGFYGYHVDHIISIMYGYRNNISPEKISHISNLQMLERQ